ncbi:Poly(ADP-ribose) polymerase catalytic domain [Seminavis robusta]|uniref:Poly(ADP-ribose) polymerase catalytic domain n=1 Tax=Seminavis robusta TaxID=568900 RepID=A0A9N8DKB2_9STRA|nr:Poly(ADP-ribose) polymerase catalytic domain [Seminavis robusta]|eukprot:Sro201_g085080.1 Poly(ADP-ribose) polymerase catalytic domain (322) ;mRNA; r:51444-52409
MSSAAASGRSRDVAGCFLFKEYSEIKPKGNLQAIVSYFQRPCNSPEFIAFCTNAGFSNSSFHANPQLKPGNPAHDKFQKAIKDLDHKAVFGFAFHGTATHNLESILRNGLDPHKRRGQAYGPGEYFGKDPGISVGYCKGGLQMLVFVVVLPSTLPPSSASTHHTVPDDFLVVNNNAHQVPIGTLKFTSVNQEVLKLSQTKRKQFLQLSKQVFDKSQIAEEGKIKARIIEYLIKGTFDLASELYEKNTTVLKDTSKRELAWYCHSTMDKEIISFYFSDLPHPMNSQELAKAKIQSVDDAMVDLCKAMQNLENERPGTWSLGY